MTNVSSTVNNFLLDYRLARENRDDLVFNIDIAMVLGEGIVGIFGDSGTGKSTLLKALAGLMRGAKYKFSLPNQDGEVHAYGSGLFINDAPASGTAKKRMPKPKNIVTSKGTLNPLIYLGAESILFEHLTVVGNLRLVQKQGRFAPQAKLSFSEAVDLCGIADLLKQTPSALSSGESQRVKFARALLSGKPCILLDEAFSALDWRTRQYFANLVVTLHKEYGFCFVMVSHSLRELAISCTRIIHLHQGQIERLDKADIMVDYFQHAPTNKEKPSNPPTSMVPNTQDWMGDVFSLLEIKVKGFDQQAKLLECIVVDAQDDTTVLLVRSGSALPINSIHKFTIDADKVSLATCINTSTSMLNCLSGKVVSIDMQDSLVIVTLLVGEQKLRSAISIRSFGQLSIKKEDVLFAMFKAL